MEKCMESVDRYNNMWISIGAETEEISGKAMKCVEIKKNMDDKSTMLDQHYQREWIWSNIPIVLVVKDGY